MAHTVRRRPIAALLLLLLVTSWPAPTAGEPDAGEGVLALEGVLAELDVPGMAVAVVQDGEIVLARGYGVRRAGEAVPVDADTLFGVASNSKAFTTAALAILVQEKVLRWDDRVTKHLPDLQMADPWVTRELTVRDLVTHRSGLGLGAGDLMWWPPTTFTRAEILRAVRHVEPATSFRSRYAYNNIMFVVAGEVVARVSGRPWGQFLQEKILGPVGMSRTTTSASVPVADGNVATPHLHLEGEPRPYRRLSFENAAGAVGVNSSARDMARWLRMLLECGNASPGRADCVLQASSVQEMWSAQTVMSLPKLPDELDALRPDFVAYGLGFRVDEYLGAKRVSHGGAVPGYFSKVTLVPAERLGIVVLTNQESRVATETATHLVLDRYMRRPDPPVDWLRAFQSLVKSRQEKNAAQVARERESRATGTRPSLPLDQYAGTFEDPWYGPVELMVREGGLVLDMTRTPGMVADLEHWQHDTFVARWRERFMSDHSPYDALVTFSLEATGEVATLSMRPVSKSIDFSFDFQDLRLTAVPGEEAEQNDD